MQLTREFELFADYFQFILLDESSDEDLSGSWTDDAAHRGIAVGTTTVSFGTLRNVTVPVEIRVSDSEPSVDLNEYDHVVTGALSLPTGVLVAMGCTDYLPDAARVILSPGTYQFLYTMSGTDTITDESGPADDHYTVMLWPGTPREATLLKHWQS